MCTCDVPLFRENICTLLVFAFEDEDDEDGYDNKSEQIEEARNELRKIFFQRSPFFLRKVAK